MSAANMCVSGFGKRGAILTGIMKVLTKAKVRELRGCVGRSAVAVVSNLNSTAASKVSQAEIDSWHEFGVEECRQAVKRAFGNLARKAWREKKSDKHVCSQG